MILRSIQGTSAKSVYIVSNDVSIANIAWLLTYNNNTATPDNIFRMKFARDETLRVKHVHKVEVRHPSDMMKLIRSYLMFTQRYDPYTFKAIVP